MCPLFLMMCALPAAAVAGPWAGREAASPPSPADETVYDRALALYRDGKFQEAAGLLEGALPTAGGGRAGHLSLLGWSRFRLKKHEQALSAFREALALSPQDADALEGVARSAARLGRDAEALDALVTLSRLHPDIEISDVADQVLARPDAAADHRLGRESARRGAAGATLLTSRARGDYFEVRDAAGPWRPLFIKGINLGAALPGKHPSEFPRDQALYADWLSKMAAMGANAVRLYTLLPPEFYRALAQHNATHRSDRRIWLLQGVWTELPEQDDYDAPAFRQEFLAEIERVVDAVHGNIAVAHRRGHAHGFYDADVSPWILGWILGREWEPYSVEAYDAARRQPAAYRGSYVILEEGTPTEAWIASVMDHAMRHETGTYGTQAPVSFTSWPTLDPLRHPTEATRREEVAILERLGLPQEPGTALEYDNDGVSIDLARMSPTRLAGAGLFASYHAYPYYPDFMNVDPGYLGAAGPGGPSSYFGYLRQLKAHHRGVPLLIAELGVPTSRGIAHHQPQGWHHGGHNEKEQGEINARLMEDVHAAGCAGGVLFAWLDEWFKKNWLVIAFEVPWENNKNWLNILDPEQNYGLMACKPGKDGWRVVIDGKGDDWAAIPPLAAGEGPIRGLRAASDEAYLYLRLDVDRLDYDAARYVIGIDTLGARQGDRRMPRGLGLTTPTGMEFVLEIDGPEGSRLLADTHYDLHLNRFQRPWRSVHNDDGLFTEMLAETNRRRVGRDGTVYPAITYSRSPLRYGTMDPASGGYDDLAEWNDNAQEGFIELRLGWNVLNVTDPSTRQVLDDPVPPRGGAGHTTTDGFRFYAAAHRPGSHEVLGTLPAVDGAGRFDARAVPFYTWQPWEEPAYHTYLKKSYFILKERLAGLRAPGEARR
ncbi:MAG TPA: tetratricopeptide repeat protein [Candidatus Polarisedimenticolia bacterium]|nr:tetratricopeptide repeat protein [Candidatus Polarisedimenticolia bacterium]